MNFNKINPVPAIVTGSKATGRALNTASQKTGLTTASKATGRALRDGTLFVTDYTELGVEKTRSFTHNKVVVPVSHSMIAHRNAYADRVIGRQIRRDERKAAKRIAKLEHQTVTPLVVDVKE